MIFSVTTVPAEHPHNEEKYLPSSIDGDYEQQSQAKKLSDILLVKGEQIACGCLDHNSIVVRIFLDL